MFEHCIYFNSASFLRKLEREWAQAFSSFGLSPSQAFLLRVVLARKAAAQNELAAEMNIARPTATRAIDQLEAMGLVERAPSEEDRRRIILRPTAKAIKIQTPLNEAAAAATRRIKKKIGDDLFQATVRAVRSASERIDEN